MDAGLAGGLCPALRGGLCPVLEMREEGPALVPPLSPDLRGDAGIEALVNVAGLLTEPLTSPETLRKCFPFEDGTIKRDAGSITDSHALRGVAIEGVDETVDMKAESS
jgi:hypothetical protein